MDRSTKIFGWVLLVAGVVIIGWTLYSSYNIFTGKAALPGIFEIEKKVTEAPTQEEETAPGSTEIQKETEKIVGEQLRELLPTDVLPKLLNLAVWSMLAFILIFGGSQISSLGVKLVKK